MTDAFNGGVHVRGLFHDDRHDRASLHDSHAHTLYAYPSHDGSHYHDGARALAVKPKMMLFDEPTSALDPELRHEVLKVMQDLAEEGMTMVIVTHEIGFAEKVASRLIFIDKGRIAEDGDPQVLIKNPPSQRLQEFLQHVS